MKYFCLSIAGFDGSGGAGIQADLKTFSALGCYGMTVLTALPIQNTTGVKSCYPLSASCVLDQLETLFEDMRPSGIKIGMLGGPEVVTAVAKFLKKQASGIPIVLDPVMSAKNAATLLTAEGVEVLRSQLIPYVTLLTPNVPEAECLAQQTGLMSDLARKIQAMGPKAVLIKGGHADGPYCDDVLCDKDGELYWIEGERVDSKNTHGTGCTLSAAIVAYLARGDPLRSACCKAKRYLSGALWAAKDLTLGKGRGPLNHFFNGVSP
ncbi:MAG: bifunctional hydroxymethylpyrimidine kinase/phosphomethylpyrimidine kinase [Alphaproteobacteria bacterium 40-19]|nr:MAG: bifunctional hydroxymethylpyrimidine kinase/phosphomethylpyrimidine kinase [Alphaproteobacteria bacterium 40-19]